MNPNFRLGLLATEASERTSTMFRNMGSGFRDKQENYQPAELLLWMLLLFGVFWLLHLFGRILARRDRNRQYYSTRSLFRALCRAHDLDSSSRRLIKQLAAAHGLAHPAHAFTRPECFEAAGICQTLSVRPAVLTALRTRLFGRSLDQIDTETVSRGLPKLEFGESPTPTGKVGRSPDALAIAMEARRERPEQLPGTLTEEEAAEAPEDFRLLAESIDQGATEN